MRLVDLSVPITSGMGTFAGTPPVFVHESHNLGCAGYRMTLVAFGNHSGTHLDAPSHFIAEGGSVDEIPLERCSGEAIVLHIPKQPLEPITIEDIGDVPERARVLIRTDWDAHLGTDEYFTHFPPLAPEAADWLAERGIWLLGVDIPSLHQIEFARMHEVLLGARVVIVESLANLAALQSSRVLFSALPLKLSGADGAPVRAVAYDGIPTFAAETAA